MGQVLARGIRGATTVGSNTRADIVQATVKLIEQMTVQNLVAIEDIAAVWFSVTGDLDAVFPAEAAREIGWTRVPLFCCREIDVAGSLPRCVRVMMLVNTRLTQEEIKHVYLNDAIRLREDL